MFMKVNILINLYRLDIRKKRHKEWKEDAESAELNASLVGFSSHNFLEEEWVFLAFSQFNAHSFLQKKILKLH